MKKFQNLNLTKLRRNSTPAILCVSICLCLMTMTAKAYTESLDLVFGDVKQGLLGAGGITEENAEVIVDTLNNDLKCNGVRVPINMESENSEVLTPACKKIIERARFHKMAIYANPMFTGTHNLSDEQYASKIIAFANRHKPKYLGCFNEFGMIPERYVSITMLVKAGLNYKPVIVGPDAQHVDGTKKLVSLPAVRNSFAIIASHNADGDVGASVENWKNLMAIAGKPVWASENPRRWSDSTGGREIGVKSAVKADVAGLVIYSAFPACVNTNGKLTPKGEEIAKAIGSRELPN